MGSPADAHRRYLLAGPYHAAEAVAGAMTRMELGKRRECQRRGASALANFALVGMPSQHM